MTHTLGPSHSDTPEMSSLDYLCLYFPFFSCMKLATSVSLFFIFVFTFVILTTIFCISFPYFLSHTGRTPCFDSLSFLVHDWLLSYWSRCFSLLMVSSSLVVGLSFRHTSRQDIFHHHWLLLSPLLNFFLSVSPNLGTRTIPAANLSNP